MENTFLFLEWKSLIACFLFLFFPFQLRSHQLYFPLVTTGQVSRINSLPFRVCVCMYGHKSTRCLLVHLCWSLPWNVKELMRHLNLTFLLSFRHSSHTLSKRDSTEERIKLYVVLSEMLYSSMEKKWARPPEPAHTHTFKHICIQKWIHRGEKNKWYNNQEKKKRDAMGAEKNQQFYMRRNE